MTLLLSHGNCSLISHEDFINQICQNCLNKDGTLTDYKINSKLFDLNVPYRQQLDNELQMKKRRRKIAKKMNDCAAKDYPDEYALVYFHKSFDFIVVDVVYV